MSINTKIYKLCFLLLCFVCTSCQENKESKKHEDEAELGKIFYATDPYMTTISAVNCQAFMTDLHHALSYLPIKDSLFVKELKEHIRPTDIDEDDYIDVRYRIEIDSTVLCVDILGQYTLNGVYQGEFSYFENLLEYIKLNKNNSTELEPLPIFENIEE